MEATKMEAWSSNQELAQSLTLHADQIVCNPLCFRKCCENSLSVHLTDVHTSH